MGGEINEVKRALESLCNQVMASKIHQPAPLLCYPYGTLRQRKTNNQTKSNKVLTSGVSITCVCDPQGAIFNCFPTNYKRRGEVTASSSREASVRRAEVDSDERVEVILASTALVAVIALFLR